MEIKYEAVEGLYTELNLLVDQMVDCIKEAKNIVNKMDGNDHWNGDGYNTYDRKFSSVCHNFAAYCNELYALNNNISSVIAKYKAVDAQVSGGVK